MSVTSLTSSLIDLDEVLAEARRRSLTRDNPLLADLPEWFTDLRSHQRVAIREILTAYEEGTECVVLDAPTGSGKTLIGETVRRLLRCQYSGTAGQGQGHSTYICSSKALQNQFVKDYPYAKVLKGRSNYATEGYPERFGGKDGLSAADCTKSPGDVESCLWCSSTHLCPYERAKYSALSSPLAVLNTSYFLSECNGPGRFSRGGFVIADEADTLESELMGHVEVRISERRLKGYGLGVPRYVTKEESWREWAEDAYEKVKARPPRRNISPDSVSAIREQKRHAILLQRLSDLKSGLATGGWVYTGDRSQVAFKPVTVNNLGQEKFWRHGDKFLLMSATVISADEMLESLGWDEDRDWRLVKCPSTFKPENRKVVVWPCASMTFKEKDIAYPKMLRGVERVLAERDAATRVGVPPIDNTQSRVLIHSTSYALTRHLSDGLEHLCRPIFTYMDSAGKDATLAAWLKSSNGILIAPSMDRGVDLPGDSCRVQIITKIPYGNLKDKQINARKWAKGGSVWYSVQAIRSLIQMCGRTVRSEDDYSVTYILDSQFGINLWSTQKRLFPSWWKEALVWRRAMG